MSRRFWIAKARRLAWRRNFASYLALFLPAALVVNAVAAVLLVGLRYADVSLELFGPACALVLIAVAVLSWFRTRVRFLYVRDALVRIEEVGHMHNGLTSAEAGVGEWPEPGEVREPTRWRWSRLLGPIGLSISLLLLAARVPIPKAQARARPAEQPLAWIQTEAWLQALDEAKLVEPDAVGKLREQLQEMRQQPAEDWYKQSSLEAGDTLRDQTEQALREMLRQLEKTDKTLAAAEHARESLPPGQLKALNDALQNSLQGLEMGNLPLNKEQLRDLKKLDPAQLKQLSAEQLGEMRARVQAGMQTAQQCVRPGANLKKELFAGDEGNGSGGGGGPAPLTFRNDATELHTQKTDTVSNQDVSQALPGDLLGLDRAEHEVNTAQAIRPAAGGAVSSAGEGGEAVRRESLTPQERQILQRYFK